MSDQEGSTTENLIYAMIIVFYAFTLADQITDGQLKMNLSMVLYRWKGKLRGLWSKQQDYERSVGKMFWQVEEVLEKGE